MTKADRDLARRMKRANRKWQGRLDAVFARDDGLIQKLQQERRRFNEARRAERARLAARAVGEGAI